MEKQVPVSSLQEKPAGLMRLSIGGEEDEPPVPQSGMEFFFHKLYEFYLDNIPVDLVKQLPTLWKVLVGFLCYCIAFGIFIYFTVINYESNIESAFISLDSTSGNCQTVPISVTASFYADGLGNWVGTPNFLYYQAPYNFNFNNFVAETEADYQAMLAVYYKSLHFYGQKAEMNNLGANLILWMSFIRFYSEESPLETDFSKTGRGNLQYLALTGDPTVVYQARFSGLALSSHVGPCEIPAMVIYDQANGAFRATMNLNGFLNSSICNAVTTPFIFQQNKNVNPYFAIQLDVRSFTIAMAVNLGFNSIPNLLRATKSLLEIRFGETLFTVGEFFDIRYPTMESIFCIYNNTAIPANAPQITHLCLISTGSGLFLPVFNHMGNSEVFRYPDYCDCETSTGHSAQCNNFYLMSSLIAFDTNQNASFPGPAVIEASLKQALTLLAAHNSDYWALNRAAYNASVASVFHAMGTAAPELSTESFLNDAYRFCKIGNQTCSLITFYTLDEDNTISEYHYPLSTGSCTDTITPNITGWEYLVNSPPTPLTQIYYKCISTTSDALINAVGVASGNTSIVMLLLLFISVPLIFGLMACFHVIPKQHEYKERHKKNTLDTLATVLLRIRDRHYEAIDRDGVAAQLAEELIHAVNFSHYETELEANYHHQQQVDRNRSLSYDRLKSHKNLYNRGNAAEFKGMEQKRELLGQEVLHRALRDHSSRLNLYSPNSPMRKIRSLDSADANGYLQPEAEVLRDLESANGTIEDHPSSDKGYYYLTVLNDIESNQTADFPGDDPSWQVPYRGCTLDTLIQGLSHYFTMALKNQSIREKKGKSINNNNNSNIGKSLQQIDVEYARGVALSQQLVKMHEKELIDRADALLFVTLANALCMHASLTLGVDMNTVANEYADRTGYQIGDKIFTYSTLVAFSLVNPSMDKSLLL